MKYNKKTVLYSVGLIIFLSIASVAFWFQEPIKQYTSVSHAMYAFDVSDKALLAEFSDDIFVGKVKKQIGPNPNTVPPKGQSVKQIYRRPETLFQVEVLETIKGNTNKIFIVNQQAGYYNGEKDKLVLLDNDPLLVEGQIYLFSTTKSKSERSGRHNIFTPKYGNILLSNLAESEKENVIQEFKDIVQQQAQ